MRYTFLID
jgi:dynein heavy chain